MGDDVIDQIVQQALPRFTPLRRSSGVPWSPDVLDVLSELMLIRGVPGHIRSNNGPELIAQATQVFLEQTNVNTLYIEPGAVAERIRGELQQPVPR